MISAWTDRGRVYASFRDAKGNLGIEDVGEARYTAYVRSPDILKDEPAILDRRPNFPGWTELVFLDYDSRLRCLEQNPTILFEADVNPVRRYISDHPEVIIDAPKRGFMDFETNSEIPFTTAVDPKGIGTQLLSFAVEGEDGQKVSAVLEADDLQAEAELWAHYWRSISAYDQIAAWNGDRFDFAVQGIRCRYLARRFPKLMKPFWEHRKRILFIDHLAAFERHHMAAGSGDEKTSFALGAVCEALLGEGKSDFDSGKTMRSWREGGAERRRLLAYNEQDTALLPKLEAKTGYLDLQQELAALSFTPANSHGLKPSPQIDGYLLRMAHLSQTHLVSKRKPTGMEQQYEGAFVQKPTKLGLHRGVHVCDFKSLYPTVIRTFNISPEMKNVGLDPCTAFRTGVQFDSLEEGMFPRLCREAMEGRERYKKEYKKDPNNKAAERKSKAFKIFNNSGYGVLGNPYFRFFDPQLAESVTLCAKHLNEATADAARERGWDVLYMDTDSLFVQGCTVDEFQAFVKWCNSDLYPRLLSAQGCNPTMGCIELDYEKEFSLLVFPLSNRGTPAAKRYVGKYAHYGFKPKDEPEIRGLEYMRTDGTRYGRQLQKKIIDLILAGEEDPAVFHEWVKVERAKFFEGDIDPNDIAASASISMDLDDYKVNSPHVRVARELAARGEDVSEGTRIAYIIADGSVSPARVIPLSDYTGEMDRFCYWGKKIYPGVMRVLAGAFPNQPWKRWIPKRPKKVLPGQLGLGLS